MKKGKMAFVLGLLIITGCSAVDYSEMAPEELALHMRIQGDEFTDSYMYIAPPLTGDAAGSVRYSANLVGIQLKSSGELVDAIQINWNYENDRWLFFQSVTLPGPQHLEASQVSRQVEGCYSAGVCRYNEIISAVIPRKELESSTTGLHLRVGSDGGTVDVVLSRNYVLGYLQGVSALIMDP